MNMILGIDLAAKSLGWALIDGDIIAGVGYHTPDAYTFKQRLTNIYTADIDVLAAQDMLKSLLTLIRPLLDGGTPLTIAAELPSGGAKSARAARCLGIATGILAALPIVSGQEVLYLPVQIIRRKIVGKANASKQQVHEAICRQFPRIVDLLANFPKTTHEHILDALGVAISIRSDGNVHTANNTHGNPQSLAPGATSAHQ